MKEIYVRVLHTGYKAGFYLQHPTFQRIYPFLFLMLFSFLLFLFSFYFFFPTSIICKRLISGVGMTSEIVIVVVVISLTLCYLHTKQTKTYIYISLLFTFSFRNDDFNDRRHFTAFFNRFYAETLRVRDRNALCAATKYFSMSV